MKQHDTKQLIEGVYFALGFQRARQGGQAWLQVAGIAAGAGSWFSHAQLEVRPTERKLTVALLSPCSSPSDEPPPEGHLPNLPKPPPPGDNVFECGSYGGTFLIQIATNE